jgi:uncharacterized protein (DUF983 family)
MNDFRRLMRLLARAALLRCPACGRPTFAKGLLSTHKACRVCGLLFEHDDGFFLGAVVVGYMITFLIGILPFVVLVATGRWSGVTGTVVAIVLCLTLPVLTYWHAKAFWMALYYWVVPGDLRQAQPGSATVHDRVVAANPALSAQERVWLEEALADLEGERPAHRPGGR